MYKALVVGLLLAVIAGTSTAAHAQGAFLLYPNYRGLIFDDRPEIVVEAPAGAVVDVADAITGAAVVSSISEASRVAVPAAGMTVDHPYTVTVHQGGNVLGRWTVMPVPASRRASMRISFDPQGRLLMHGRPRFALGVYDSGGGYSNDPNHYERLLFAPDGARRLGDMPLNLYLNYHWGQAPVSAMNALMGVLQKRGIMYLQTGNCFADGSHTRIAFAIHSDTYVTEFAGHPAAAGYYIADECTDRLIPETTENHQRLAQLDPHSLTLAVTLAKGYIDPRKWVDAADVIGTDPYPLYGKEPTAGYTHFQVADYVAYAKAAVRDTRPTFAVLQFFKFTSDSRYPTAEELRAHAVMSIVEGARGIFWWDIGVNGVRKNADAATIATQMANLDALVRELATLEPVLLAEDTPGALTGNSTRHSDSLAGRKAQLQHNIAVEWLFSNKRWYQAELDRLHGGDTGWSPMLPDAATVRTKVKVVDGIGYVFAYNYTNQRTPVTFTWHRPLVGVTEHRTGFPYAVAGSSWSDTLGAYEARVYVVAALPATLPDWLVGASDPIDAFVTHLYREALQRTPDAGGLAGWRNLLRTNCNAWGFEVTAQGFFGSPEFSARRLTLDQLVTIFYRTLLGRPPDAVGLAYWTDLLRHLRLSLALHGFVPSSEFQGVLPNPADPGAVRVFVSRLYGEILQRSPAESELMSWVNYTISTRDVAAVVHGFLVSPEFELRELTFEEFITMLYRALLARDPDSAGLDGWLWGMHDGMLQMLRGFLTSPEFQGLRFSICGTL